jgi:hypothetical protein
VNPYIGFTLFALAMDVFYSSEHFHIADGSKISLSSQSVAMEKYDFADKFDRHTGT